MPPVEVKNLLVLDLFLDDQHGAHLEDHVAERVREVHVVRHNVNASCFRSTLLRKDHGEHEQEDKEDEGVDVEDVTEGRHDTCLDTHQTFRVVLETEGLVLRVQERPGQPVRQNCLLPPLELVRVGHEKDGATFLDAQVRNLVESLLSLLRFATRQTVLDVFETLVLEEEHEDSFEGGFRDLVILNVQHLYRASHVSQVRTNLLESLLADLIGRKVKLENLGIFRLGQQMRHLADFDVVEQIVTQVQRLDIFEVLRQLYHEVKVRQLTVTQVELLAVFLMLRRDIVSKNIKNLDVDVEFLPQLGDIATEQ